jgi:hypothetical protein
MQRLYLRHGQIYTVTDTPQGHRLLPARCSGQVCSCLRMQAACPAPP